MAIVTFGPVKVETDFISAQQFVPPELIVNGDTPMGEAIETGLNMLRPKGRLQDKWHFILSPMGIHDHRWRPHDSWQQRGATR